MDFPQALLCRGLKTWDPTCNNALLQVNSMTAQHKMAKDLVGWYPASSNSITLPVGLQHMMKWPSTYLSSILASPVSHQIIERMRAPVREAFSYGIRHWIRHIHCDSMSYDQIRVKPWETIPRIIPRIPQYGVWYSADACIEMQKISCKSLQKSIEAMVMKEKRLPQITLSLFD